MLEKLTTEELERELAKRSHILIVQGVSEHDENQGYVHAYVNGEKQKNMLSIKYEAHENNSPNLDITTRYGDWS